MSRIIILDDTLISKIAAGEVIERPSSVVKELIENSIDAGSNEISIEVKDGGKRQIKVSDNGRGMNREEAILSIERHSTSKIRTADDLFNIKTLGFRGEALPSIASVSRFEMITRDSSDALGTKLAVEGGKKQEVSGTGCPCGTSILVEELFFNTPARLKFMKSKSTELSNIVDIVSKFVLSDPNISFKLKSDGDEILSSTGSGDLLDAVASVYGMDMAKAMLEVKNDNSVVKVHGYISQPVVTKSDRYGESLYVNGRFIRNILISKALEGPYRTLIPNGKYPIAVIFVDIDPADIDVNVHPAKREVKFARPDVAIKAVSCAVSQSLAGVGLEAEAGSYSGSWRVDRDQWRPEMIKIMDDTQISNYRSQMTNGSIITNDRTVPLFQLNLTYIISVDGEDLVLIDQHAAHERIMYEKIKSRKISGTQSLLVPMSIEVDPYELSVITGNVDEIREIGFDIEPFGKNTVMVRGIPASLNLMNIDAAVSEIISELCEAYKIISIDERKESIWKMMACKAAVKAGDKLSLMEMEGLIKELYITSNPATCPHGRPTHAKISRKDMEKMFAR